MADTLPNVALTKDWQSVETLTNGSIPAGAPCVIQNQCRFRIYCVIGPVKPVPGMAGIAIPPDVGRPLTVPAGENQVWLMCRIKNNANVNIQEG